MSDVRALLTRCRELGAEFLPSPDGKLKVRAPAPLPKELQEQLRQCKAEIIALLKTQTPARAFLSRPWGQEDNADPWEAWAPLMTWLREHHPDRFFVICEAEESIRVLERQGITAGQEYEQACAALLWVFEEARRLKLSEGVKVWIQ